MKFDRRLYASFVFCLGVASCARSASDDEAQGRAGAGGADSQARAGGAVGNGGVAGAAAGGMAGNIMDVGGNAGSTAGSGGGNNPDAGTSAMPDAGGVAMAPLVIPPNAKTWTGMGADNRWATPGNWSGGTVPDGNDDVVLDGTTPKTCVLDSNVQVGSITVTPEYQGVFRISSQGRVNGNLVLSGKVAMSFNPHTSFDVHGPVVDLSRVTRIGVTYSGGNLALAGMNVVQAFYPPADPSVVVFETWVLDGSTMLLKGNLNSIGLYVEKGGKIDFNHKDAKLYLIGIAGYASNLGGSTIAVNGFANYTTNGFGFSYHSPNPGIRLDLAPDEPWHLQVHQDKAWYGDVPKTFKIVNSDIGNLQATGDPIELVNCTDQGGNSGLVFP